MDIESEFGKRLSNLGAHRVIAPNLVSLLPETMPDSQEQTADSFSRKWGEYDYGSADFSKMVEHQKGWYLELYGFADERALAGYLKGCRTVLDAGAGKGYKAAWFAELSPSTTVIAADISDSILRAAEQYRDVKNLFFVQCDISDMPFFEGGLFDYVSCDQVIHHTAAPYRTFRELVRVTGAARELSVYVYRKKAVPRELLDEFFREHSKSMDHEALMALSRQMTDLGRILSANDQEIDFPDIPALGIEGGRMTVQRFLYWNFFKAYWNPEQGEHNSLMINYDWYSPSQAFRYSEEEFREWGDKQELKIAHFHRERACYAGRFSKR